MKLLGQLAVVLWTAAGALAQLPPPPTSAPQNPACWLVVYNTNSVDSQEWAAFYQTARGIPAENMLGLPLPLDESFADYETAERDLIQPVRDVFAADPEFEAQIMGILLGYRVPGYYVSSIVSGPGGRALDNALQDLNDAAKETHPQTAALSGAIPPVLSKADLLPGHYLVGRVDAPNVDLAKELTLRALLLENPRHCLTGQHFYYDYTDTHLSNDRWYWLQQAVENPDFAAIPWQAFDADTESTPLDAFRFGTHDVAQWNNGRLNSEPAGSRVLAYNFNSWGATTVRSTTGEGGRYVPNAIHAGYAAAIGATGEPASAFGPFPWVLIDVLQQGRTLGEAMYLANPNDDWVWTCVGDPLLRVGTWFDRPCGGFVTGDVNCDGFVDFFDIDAFTIALTSASQYAQRYPGCDILTADIDGDGSVGTFDIDPFVALLSGL